MSARAVLSRVVPFLLPPAAGAVCWVVSGMRQATPAGSAGARTAAEVRSRAAGKPETREAAALRGMAERIAAANGVEALAALWWEVRDAPGGEPGEKWLSRLIFDRMLDADAAAAWAWVRTFPETGAPPHPEADFLTAWGARDAEAAAAAVLAQPGAGKGDFYSIALAGLKADPLEFLTRQIYAPWITNTGQLQALRMEALRALAEKDVNEALELAPRFCQGGGPDNVAVLRSIAGQMIGRLGLGGAIAKIGELLDWNEASLSIMRSEVLSELALEDPAAAGREFLKFATEATGEAGIRIARLWAGKDPAAAIRFFMRGNDDDPFAVGPDNQKSWQLRAIAEVIGPDLPTLMSAVTGLPTESDWKPLLSEVMRREPGKTLTELAAAPAFPQQRRLIEAAIMVWKDNDPLAALRGLRALPEELGAQAKMDFAFFDETFPIADLSSHECGELLREMLADPVVADALVRSESPAAGMLLGRIVGSAPGEALALLAETPEGGLKSRTEGWRSVLSAWAGTDPDAAAAWVTQPSAGTPPEMILPAAEGMLDTWMKYDPMAASRWAEALPPGDLRETAAVRMAGILQTWDGPSALAWAVSVEDAEGRLRAVEQILALQDISGTARDVVNLAEIPEAAKAECLRILDELTKRGEEK